MSMKEWAKNEVKIACEREKELAFEEGGDVKFAEYGVRCYKSALKAFNSLCKDGHSGYSIGITRSILDRLIDGKPLTPIKDIPEVWNKCCEDEDGVHYQCNRMSSLFKDVYKDGTVKYSDVDRVQMVYDNNPTVYWHSALARRVVDEMFPMEMPYTGEEKFLVHGNDCLVDRVNGDFDTIALFYVEKKTPSGTEKIKINRYFREPKEGEEETYPGWVEISRTTYNRRKKKAEERIANLREE